MKTGLIIKELRVKKGLTQEELADKTELSTRTIQRIEKGEVDPRAYTLQMIAKALDVDFSIFVDDESFPEDEKSNKNDITLAFLHLSGILPILIPSILIWKYNKMEIEDIHNHFKEIMSFQLTAWLAFIIGFIQYYKMSMPYIIYAAIFFTVFFSIMNAINVFNGKPYMYLTLFKLNKKNTK